MEKQIIEIKGVKFEVDLRTATRIEEFKVGDGVKILKKEGYDNKFVPYVGTIVGFDDFAIHPTIIVAYLRVDYSEVKIEFAYINSESADVELCAINEWDLPYSKIDILSKMDAEIAKAEERVLELNKKKNVFLKMFGKYFDPVIVKGTII